MFHLVMLVFRGVDFVYPRQFQLKFAETIGTISKSRSSQDHLWKIC